MNIVVADTLPASALDLLTREGWTVDARGSRPAADLARDLAEADALIVRSATRVTADLIAAAPRLKAIARAGTGVDNVDVAAATARGIVVMNAPGANSISVAEHACALMLALSRAIPAADRAMKEARWEKQRFMGTELRGKTLGIVGLGRIGQEVARRASAFGMRVVAYDPYIARHVAAELHVDLVSLDQLCDAADYISLHVPATATTDRFFDGGRLGRCKTGVRIINTARGDLIDETALAEAIERGIVGGAALDVFHDEPPKDWRLMSLPQVIATPHIAASTYEAQELVGTETVEAVRDFLRDGIIRNAVNFPAISPEELKRVQPFMKLAERLGTLVAQMGEARVEKITVRYYGELAQVTNTNVLANSVLVGALSPILSSRVSLVNAREEATARGIEIVESRSTRPRNFTRLLSVKMITDTGERWVEGTLFEHGSLRLVSINGVEVEAPLDGTMLVIENNDLPGVIGDVGGILGRHQINIATFALGRRVSGAVGVVNLDVDGAGDRRQESAGDPLTRAVDEIRRVPAVTNAWLIQIG